MIAVVLGADDAYSAAARLLDQGFATPLDAAETEQIPGVAFHPASTGPHRQKGGRLAAPPVASGHGRPAHRGVPWTIPLSIVVVTVAVLVVLRPRAQRSQWRTARRSVSFGSWPAGWAVVDSPRVERMRRPLLVSLDEAQELLDVVAFAEAVPGRETALSPRAGAGASVP